MKRFTNILMIIDADADNSAALKRAVTLAKNNQASLTACTVVDELPKDLQSAITAITPAELGDIVVAERQEQLNDILKAVDSTDGVSIDTVVLIGRPFIEIIRRVIEHGYDLVIKCAEKSDHLIKDVLFGNSDMHLMRKCPCPVWIIKPTDHEHYKRILAAVDRDIEEPVKDELNQQILEMSTSLALADFSELHIVHAWRFHLEPYLKSQPDGISSAEVDEMVSEEAKNRHQWLEQLVDYYGTRQNESAVEYLDPQLHLTEGDAKHVVPACADELNADLIVMGTVARTGLAGFFMGNTAERILSQIDCSVLTLKPPGFVSPVTLAE